MYGLGGQEILIIAMILLVLVGPVLLGIPLLIYLLKQGKRRDT